MSHLPCVNYLGAQVLQGPGQSWSAGDQGQGSAGELLGAGGSLTQALAFPEAMCMALGVPFSGPLLTTADGALAGAGPGATVGSCQGLRLWDPSGH